MGNNSSVPTQFVIKDSTDGPLVASNNFTISSQYHSSSDLHRISSERRRSKTLSGEYNTMSFAVKTKRSSRKAQRRLKSVSIVEKQHTTSITFNKDEFFAAVIRGDIEQVCTMLDDGIDVNITDRNYLTALHYAAMHARPDMIDLLIQYGADVNACDMKGGFSPIHWVTINSHLTSISEQQRLEQCLISLVRGGCNVNAKDFNQATPLHFAARTDNRAVVDTLMRLDANPNDTDVLGRTCAAVAKSPETKILIIKLADLRARAYYHVLEIPHATI
jgi:ankyrin repeat protein